MYRLRKDITDGHDLYHLYRNVGGMLNTHKREVSQSNAFWSLVLMALQDAAMLRLCRVYDQDDDAVSLHTFLLTVRDSPDIFREEEFRKRLADNPFLELLARLSKGPAKAQLERDVLMTSKKDPLVRKLILLRHKAIAHSDYGLAKEGKRFLHDPPLTGNEWLALIDRSFDILNRYATLFGACTYSMSLIGENDYKSLFHFLRLGLKKHDEDLDA
jgi:hypothetical protein